MTEDFQTVLDNSPVLKSMFDNAVVNAFQIMDEEGFILNVSKSFTRAFGYDNDDLRGKHSRVLFTDEDQKKLLPEIEIEKVRQHGSCGDRNYLVHKDSSCVWVTGESLLVKEATGKQFIFKVLQNIHEQKVMEKFLTESQEFSESVVGSITDALVVIDNKGKILKSNNAFYNVFEINTESIDGEYLAGVNHSFLSSPPLVKKVAEVISTESTQQVQMDWKDANGTSKSFLINFIPMVGKLMDTKVLMVIADVTIKVQLEQQREDLLAFVIHELRSPLANITLSNKLLKDAIEEEDKTLTEDYIERIKVNTSRLNTLTRELFEATKAGAGHLTFKKALFNFEDLVKEVINNVQLTSNTHRIRKEGEANIEVYADRNRMHQVLSNYLTNAIKYSPEADKVEVRVSTESGNVIVAVTDYGMGIPQDQVQHLFNRYYRVDSANRTDGLGLGLFLSKQIIDAHNGRVWITSKAEEGSTFYFSIPY
ncbi:MAG: sensor histidine kinase [Segetibacter sp.]|nr:sensor histidine kinase [Segetibacter sp.]